MRSLNPDARHVRRDRASFVGAARAVPDLLSSLLGSNVAGVLFGAAMYGMFFGITLYLQQVLGYSPLKAGFAWLALWVTALLSSVGGAQLVTRTGPRRPLAAGLAIAAVGIWLLSPPGRGDLHRRSAAGTDRAPNNTWLRSNTGPTRDFFPRHWPGL